MGFRDVLKKLFPEREPLQWDAHSVRHPLGIALRLPEGWQFTAFDEVTADASGPGNQAVKFYIRAQFLSMMPSPEEIESFRPKALELMKGLVKHDSQLNATPVQKVLPSGVLWTEASEVKGAEQHFVAYAVNLQPRDAKYEGKCPMICLRTSVPAGSGALGAERLEKLREVLRTAEWT